MAVFLETQLEDPDGGRVIDGAMYMPSGRVLPTEDRECMVALLNNMAGKPHDVIDDVCGTNRTKSCPADFDDNGVVDIADMSALLVKYGPCESDDCPWDITNDGKVDIADHSNLLVAWGDCPVLGENKF